MLGSPAQSGTENVGLDKDVLADGTNLERPQPQGSAPIEAAAFYDGAASAHKAGRDEERDRVHQAGRDEGAMYPAAALDQKRLHPAFGKGT